MTINMTTFHGSPGSIRDFLPLDEHMKDYLITEDLENSEVWVGYSWGCLKLLNSLQNSNVKKVVLISPFLPMEPVRGLKKFIISLPWIGKFLLKLKREKILGDFIKQSFCGKDGKNEYQNYIKSIVTVDKLFSSIEEKDEFFLTEKMIEECKGSLSGITPLVIWGKSDRTAKLNEELKKLSQIFEDVIVKEIEKGGHALMWSHPQKIANLIKKYQKGDLKCQK
ncbi:MAG: hypothetical protein H6621_03045 [Halobacteriovoraceae bacterium]|nr:hypothetical protein [Halobacteriovoraceae bacterium]MCB9094022.1 hypothetical protein [Halobacteriovoraceae bacterium]